MFDNTHGNQLKDIAQANQFEEEKFIRANRQADLQEEKYEEVWGALMGARDEDPTLINMYDSNRRLYDSTTEYINQYTDAGTSITPNMLAQYEQLQGQELDPKMTELMSKGYDLNTTEGGQAFYTAWSKIEGNKQKPNESYTDHLFRAGEATDLHYRRIEAKEIMGQLEQGQIRVMDDSSVAGIVASLMDNPPPGLFENINSNYGILNDAAKREVLTGFVNSTVSAREFEQFYDEETDTTSVSANDLEWGDTTNKWIESNGQLKEGYNTEIFSDRDSAEETYLNRFLERTEHGAAVDNEIPLYGVDVMDFLNQKDTYGVFYNDDGDFRMTGKGKSMLSEVAGAFNGRFSRNPTVREALLFIRDGELSISGDDASLGYSRAFSVRMVPENWIDNYNEPGQLEGIFALLNGGNVTPERNVGRTSGWSKFGNIAGGIVGAAAGAFAGGIGAGVGKKIADI